MADRLASLLLTTCRRSAGERRAVRGYRGLHRTLAVRQVTPDVDIAAGRIAGRWHRAVGLTWQVIVPGVDQAMGR